MKNKTFGIPNKAKIDDKMVCTVRIDDDCQIIRPLTSHGTVIDVLGGPKIPTSSGYNKTLGLPGTGNNKEPIEKKQPAPAPKPSAPKPVEAPKPVPQQAPQPAPTPAPI